MIEWDLQPIYGSLALVIALALLSLAALVWIKLDRQLPWRKRFVLTSLRFLAIAWLVLSLLRPGITWTSSETSRQSVAVLVDTSASMQLPSGNGSDTRWDVERRAIERLQRAGTELGKEVEWRLFGYDSQLRSLTETTDLESAPSASGPWIDSLPSTPKGPTTDIGIPVARVLSTVSEPPLLGVVWMGDGAQTTRGDTTDAQQAARQYAQLDIPLYLIGIGPRSGAEETRDQIVDGVADQRDAFAKSRVPIRGNLRAIGLQGRELKVAIFLRNEQGSLQRLNQVVLKSSQVDQVLPFDLPIIAPEPGAYQLTVKAEPVDGEATLLNNEQTCFLNVRDSGSRILYLEGQPGFEQRFIRIALADSKDLEVDWEYIPETTRANWPITMDEALQNDMYDCIILGDLDADALGKENLERLAKIVEEGVGLITLGGYHAYAGGGYADSPLARILPMEMDPKERQVFGKPLDTKGHWTNEILLTPRGTHPIFDLSNESLAPDDNRPASVEAGRSDASWSSLRPLLGANRWRGFRKELAPQIVAVGPNDEPLIVTNDFGRGRVLCCAFDSSYRWWQQGNAALHRRFWRQAVLWTMRREETTAGFRLVMPKRAFSLGESSYYQIAWTPGSENRAMPSELDVRWMLDGVDRGPLLPARENDRQLRGELSSFEKAGRYEIVVRGKSTDGEAYESKLPFVVIDMAIEKLQSAPDWQLMNQLAKLNEAAGGKIVAPESTDEIIRSLQERRRTFHVDSVKTIRLGEGTLDSWTIFLVLTSLFILQWFLRKAWNLP